MGEKKEKQDKGLPSQGRLPSNICPQCGQFPGSTAGVKNREERASWGQKSLKCRYSKKFIGGKTQKEDKLSEKVKFALYLPPEEKAELERRYREDGSRSITAFIGRAIDFYLSYLSASSTGAFLPKELQAAIDGRLGMFEDRMAKLLYKLTVEMDMGMSATLDCIQIDADYLRRLRANSVRNVKATNGLLTFEQKARAYDDYAEGDDQWHG